MIHLSPRLILFGIAGLILCSAAGFALWMRAKLHQSVAILDGQVVVAGLAAPVRIDRDGIGVPTIRAETREDAYRALGFLHAQDRFFQMDLLRRVASGELAELFGDSVLALDLRHRIHRLRRTAQRAFEFAAPDERALVQAYADGVNAGLGALHDRPFEYRLLFLNPRPWSPEDSYLAALAMFIDMQLAGIDHERSLMLLRETLPPALVDFLVPLRGPDDAPLVGEVPPPPPIPGPEVFDWRTARPLQNGLPPVLPEVSSKIGSNAIALGAARTADGRALIANDMHLGLTVPPVWYRARIIWGPGDVRHDVTGTTLPGVPAVVTGSNGAVAWAFTNAYADVTDLILLELGEDGSTYRTPAGFVPFDEVRDTLLVRGRGVQSYSHRWTIWGPVIGTDPRGAPIVVSWVAHSPLALSLRAWPLAEAGNITEAVDAARRLRPPVQNIVIGDSAGSIAWVLGGAVPRRSGFDGRDAGSWADGSRRWLGLEQPRNLPAIVDPPSGAIWSANQRHLPDGPEADVIGDGYPDPGYRASAIRGAVLGMDGAKEADLLGLMLEDRVPVLLRWRDLLMVSHAGALPEAAAAELAAWDGGTRPQTRAAPLVRAFREAVIRKSVYPFSGYARASGGAFHWPGPRAGDVALRLATERPAHLLPPGHESWDALLAAAAAEAVRMCGWKPGRKGVTLDEARPVILRHPLGGTLSWMDRWLNVRPGPLPGDLDAIRVQGGGFGASQRSVVAPGREEDGIFQLAGGQSGHPFSPFHRAGLQAWIDGLPAPFLPGEPTHTLQLTPADR
jgi:penicillin amidase